MRKLKLTGKRKVRRQEILVSFFERWEKEHYELYRVCREVDENDYRRNRI